MEDTTRTTSEGLAVYVPIPFRPDRVRSNGVEWTARKIIEEACQQLNCSVRDLHVFNWYDGDPAAWKR